MVGVAYDRGVFLPAADFWLDPAEKHEFAFVSHAHSDHTARHERILCTPATARLMQVRMGGKFSAFETLEYGTRKTFGSWSVVLLPAGHILGSAQLYFESAEGTLLYTGDFKLRPGLSAEPAAALQAETLIMETTFGLPRYQFPPSGEVMEAVVKFCHEALEDGETPVLLGYALGKAQEILSVLRQAGLPIMLHGAVEKVTRVYEEFGVKFPPFVSYSAGAVAGHVLICPPSASGSRMLTKIPKARVAMLTGWAMDAGAVHRLRVDAAFPLSDHADYPDLWRHVEAVRPDRVLTLHGFAQEFARDLRAQGLEAWALTGANQLDLALPMSERVRPSRVEVSSPQSGFNRFAAVCESIRATTGKLEKIRQLAGYLAALDEVELPQAATWLTGRAFSLGQPLNVGWAVTRRALCAASGLGEGELRVIARGHNDSGLTAAEAMQSHPGAEALPLAEVAAFLRNLRDARGPLLKGSLLAAVFRRIPAAAAGYLVRILSGDLRIGLKEGLVEEGIARAFGAAPDDVREAHMLTGDIGHTALLARTGRLDTAELVIFQPVKCMLASPEPDAVAVWDRLGGSGSVWLEDKLDGIRAQLHRSGNRVEIYSRELKTITATFPEIAAAARELGRDAVCDGEILAWDKGRALSFFELQKRLGRREADLFLGGQVPVAYVVFDLLQLDGRSLLKSPLVERRRHLESLTLQPPLLRAAITRAASAGEIDTVFTASRNRGNEGLVAKDPGSAYTPGRRGLAWIKLKKEFASLDVVVVAAEYGHGRRSKVLSDYTFAVRDEATGALLTIGKAYSGLTDGEINELTREFLEHELSRRGNRIEVAPRIVLEIAFDAIQPSDRHASGFALRFPRINGIRRDKTVRDIDTLAAARRLAGAG